jgi:hypothetical protein
MKIAIAREGQVGYVEDGLPSEHGFLFSNRCPFPPLYFSNVSPPNGVVFGFTSHSVLSFQDDHDQGGNPPG